MFLWFSFLAGRLGVAPLRLGCPATLKTISVSLGWQLQGVAKWTSSLSQCWILTGSNLMQTTVPYIGERPYVFPWWLYEIASTYDSAQNEWNNKTQTHQNKWCAKIFRHFLANWYWACFYRGQTTLPLETHFSNAESQNASLFLWWKL